MFKKLFLTTGSVATAMLPLVSTVACGQVKNLHIKVNVYFLPGDDISLQTPENVDSYLAMANLIGHTLAGDSVREISELEFTLVSVEDGTEQSGMLDSSKLVNPLDEGEVYSTFREYISIPEDEEHLNKVNAIYEPYADENSLVWGGVLGLEIFKLFFNNIDLDE